MAYYEALSELERTTREAKEATIRPSQNPATPSNSFPSEQNPVSLVPFPALCAALGAASLQSLHLTGDADAVASVCGGIVGAAIGGLVVVGDDPVGGFTRAVGATIARGVGFAGGWVGKEVRVAHREGGLVLTVYCISFSCGVIPAFVRFLPPVVACRPMPYCIVDRLLIR